MAVQNDSYAEMMDAFSLDEFWANRSSRSAVYAEMLLLSSSTPVVSIPSVVVTGGGESSRLWSNERESSGVQSERACLSYISLWAFKSAQIISFSCISGLKTDIEKPIRRRKWEFSGGRCQLEMVTVCWLEIGICIDSLSRATFSFLSGRHTL